jgi:flagellar biosynthesis/type III secretory pathway chaperone
MKLIENLKNILAEQVGSYSVLLDILHRERAHLLNLDAPEVEHISKEKDTIVLRLRLLEEERLRLMKKLSAESGIGCDTTLRMLSELTGDDTFQFIRLKLVSLLQGIREMNGFNRVIIERSLTAVKNTLLFLEPFDRRGNQTRKGALLSKEA